MTSAAVTLASGSSVEPIFALQGSPSRSQRTVVIMFDGFGLDYLESSTVPTLRRWQKDGLFKKVKGIMPSVTNANNTSICCGAFPQVHGITGNSYLDAASGREEYMEAGNLLLAPTLFEYAAHRGVSSALLSSKKKTISLLSKGTSVAMTPEEPPAEWVERLGPAPPIYSREVNYWVLRAAINLLKNRPEIGCLYVHTTDYPMHTWPPDANESQEHVNKIDELLGEASSAAPDAAFLLTADHGMNHKRKCYDLDKVLGGMGLPIRISISAERDRYMKHHRGFGGTSWVYLQKASERDKVMAALSSIPGVESVLTRDEAAARYSLYASRVGELCVFGDKQTVFGEMDQPSTDLPDTYRSHGSTSELDIPLFAYNARGLPPASYFEHNLDLTRWLYRI
ncbi:MAG TPA: alkaline phosphatase family protein [Bryobacteraceae bacterium]|nr:alkaline phosphatase family protein [Bryobacteraceae bacterium]